MGSETAMQVSQILIKSTESKSTIGVNDWCHHFTCWINSRVCGVTKSLNLIWHVEVLPQKNIHYPESTTFFIWINSYRFFYF
jgi:membrane protein